MKRRAFTLVELLVVIAIVGLLSTVAIIALGSAREKASLARGLQFENSINNALGSEVVAVINFDQGTGTTATDTSGNTNNATLLNGATWRCASTNKSYTPSGEGCALSLDGDNDFATTTISGLNDGTVSLWFNDQSSISGDVVIGRRTTGCFGSAIYVLSTGLLRIYNTGPEVTIGSYVSKKWNHLAVVRTGNGAAANYYINGRLVFTNAFNLNLNELVSQIGGTCAGVGSFGGYIDNVRIYNTALGASRIQKLYAEEKIKFNKLGV